MKNTGSKIIIEALVAEKIRFVFGIPGTHNIEFYDAMIDEKNIDPILITDEQSAGFMADGVFRAAGEVAAVSLVPGAGTTHALSGIAECYLDQIPLVVIASAIRSDLNKSYQLHAIDQSTLLKTITKKTYQPRDHQELYVQLREACQLTKKPPYGPVAVEVPANLFLFEGEYEEGAPCVEIQKNIAIEKSVLEKAASILNGSENIGLYVGLGTQNARVPLYDLAEHLDALVFTTISGKGVYPETHPRWAWNTMGRAAPPDIYKLERKLDCLLAIGCRFAEVATASYGFEPPQNFIHVDIDGGVLNRNYPAALTVEADAGDFIRALIESKLLKKRTPDQAKLESLAVAQQKIKKEFLEPSDVAQNKVSPGILFHKLQEVCGAQTAFVVDSGNGMFLSMQHLRLDRAQSYLAPVDFSCMGYSMPAGIGAKLQCPERPVVILPGDGAFMMTGFELATAAQYGVGVMVFLLRDFELSQIAQFQRMSLNREVCTKVLGYDASFFAKSLGVECLRLEHDEDVSTVIKQALELSQQGQPVLVDVRIDYSKPSYFTRGTLKNNFGRLPFKDRLRMVSRVASRKLHKAFFT